MRIHENASVENDDFDEEVYLIVNPDVARAVAQAQFQSGKEHYLHFGLKEGRIASARSFILYQAREHSIQQKSIAELDGQVAHLVQALAASEGQLAAIRSSISWRITAPLRAIVRPLISVCHAMKTSLHAVQLNGGLNSSIKMAFQLYRVGGFERIRTGFEAVSAAEKAAPALPNPLSDRNDYQRWIQNYDTLTDELRFIMRTHIDSFAQKPVISVVMPTYNPRPEWLTEAIESVRKQIYPYWELCISDDASTDITTRPILERFASEDARIKVVFRENNGHISAASNSALEVATGEWVALLDHDDLLSEHALFWVAKAINENPEVRLIYSDEDKIDEIRRRRDPYFKCDWNVDLFYSHNLITHLGVYNADLVKEIGGFRIGFEGAQDYDLALRSIERIAGRQIHHIPRVLYHWRMHDQSTALTADAKPYAMLAGERAINEHLTQRGIRGQVEFVGCGYRLRYKLPDILPLVSIVIPTKNGLQLIRQCINSIRNNTVYPNYEILIIDNASDDPATLSYLESLKAVPLTRVTHDPRPFNYSALNNAAVQSVRGEVVALLNNDLEVISPEWLSEMVSIALQPNVGAVGAKLWYPNNTLQHGGVILGIGGVAGHAHKNLSANHHGYFSRASLVQSMSAVTAACLVIRKEIYEEVGGLNEKDLEIAFNDIDFCLRVRKAGYRNIWTPYAELYHHESATRGQETTPEKKARFAAEVRYMMQTWGDCLIQDPAYSPNLTLHHEDFSYAWPPRVEPL